MQIIDLAEGLDYINEAMTAPSAGKAWGLAAFWAIAFVLSFLNLSGFLMNDDEGTYLYAAWRTSLGEVPYRDFAIVQTPLFFYLGAAVFKISEPAVWPARALSVLFILGTAFLIYSAARRFLKMEIGYALAAAGIFLFNKHVFFLGRSFMPDVPMIFFGAAALYFALRGEESGIAAKPARTIAGLAGLMAGLSTLAKLNGVLVLAGYMAYLLYKAVVEKPSRRETAAKAVWSGLGFLLAFVLPFGLLLIFVPGTYDAVIGFHAAKEASSGFAYGILVLRRLGQTVGNHNYAIAAGALAAFVFGRLRTKASERRSRTTALLWILTAAALVLLFLPSRFFIRYAVYAAVPAALLFGDGLRKLVKNRPVGRFILPGLAVLVLLCLGPTLSPKRILARDKGTRAAVAFIRENTGPEDYVFGDDPFLNFLARRPCPPKLVDVSEAMITSGRISAAVIREECDRLAVKMVFVETGASAHHLAKLPDFAAFRNNLLDRYRPAGTIRREFLDVEFFLR